MKSDQRDARAIQQDDRESTTNWPVCAAPSISDGWQADFDASDASDVCLNAIYAVLTACCGPDVVVDVVE